MKCEACGKELSKEQELKYSGYCNEFCKEMHERGKLLLDLLPGELIPENEIKIKRVVEYNKIDLFGTRYENCSFENYKLACEAQEKMVVKVKKIADDIKNGIGHIIAFVGESGTGKDHIAAAMIDYVKPKRCKHTTVQRISRELRETLKKQVKTNQQEIIDMYTHLDILIINEIGIQSVTAFERNFLHEIIDTIYRNVERSCILISNLGIDKFKTCIDEPGQQRVLDRIKDKIIFDWKSYR